MTRHTRPGSIQSVLQEAFRANGGIENCAADMGVAIKTVSMGTAPTDEGGGINIHKVDALARIAPAVAVVLARHFASLAGGSFVAAQGERLDNILAGAGSASKEAGEAIAAALSAGQSSSVEDHARAAIESREAEVAFRRLAEGHEAHLARTSLTGIKGSVQ